LGTGERHGAPLRVGPEIVPDWKYPLYSQSKTGGPEPGTCRTEKPISGVVPRPVPQAAALPIHAVLADRDATASVPVPC
jgi:hypothetical protein